jgi:hypothetical protein
LLASRDRWTVFRVTLKLVTLRGPAAAQSATGRLPIVGASR